MSCLSRYTGVEMSVRSSWSSATPSKVTKESSELYFHERFGD